MRMVTKRELASKQVYNINSQQTAGFRDNELKKRKQAVKQMWLKKITVHRKSLNGEFLPMFTSLQSKHEKEDISQSPVLLCCCQADCWMTLATLCCTDCRFTSTQAEKRDTEFVQTWREKQQRATECTDRSFPPLRLSVSTEIIVTISKAPRGVFLQTNKRCVYIQCYSLKTFCLSLRSNKHVECISFLIKHLQSWLLKHLKLYSFTFSHLQFSLLPLFVYCRAQPIYCFTDFIGRYRLLADMSASAYMFCDKCQY